MGLALPCKEETKTKQAQKGKKESLYLLCFPRLQLTITPNLTTTAPPFLLKRKKNWIHACSLLQDGHS